MHLGKGYTEFISKASVPLPDVDTLFHIFKTGLFYPGTHAVTVPLFYFL